MTTTRKIDLTPSPDVDVGDTVGKLSGLGQVKVGVSVVVGRSVITLDDLKKFGRGSVIELNTYVGQPAEVLVNGLPVAKGEIVVIEDRIGVTLTEVLRKTN